jgi:hypothetical protein
MRSFDHCGNAHTVYQRHKDRHMDRIPDKSAAAKMAVRSRASVCASRLCDGEKSVNG